MGVYVSLSPSRCIHYICTTFYTSLRPQQSGLKTNKENTNRKTKEIKYPSAAGCLSAGLEKEVEKANKYTHNTSNGDKGSGGPGGQDGSGCISFTKGSKSLLGELPWRSRVIRECTQMPAGILKIGRQRGNEIEYYTVWCEGMVLVVCDLEI